MNEIDEFIILAREDVHSDKGWREALQAVGLGKRIKAVVFSSDPEKAISFTVDQTGRADITGLSRNHITGHPEFFAKVRAYIEGKF